jgi:multiple sugar transport system permease protein
MRTTAAERTARTIVLAIALVITLVPVLSLFLDSFKSNTDFFSGSLLPRQWTLQFYHQAFSDTGGARYDLINSITVAALTTVFSVALGTLAAFGMARLGYRWMNWLMYAILAVRFYPKITTVLPYYVLMRHLGLLDTITAVVIAHVSITLPFVVLILDTFFREVPASLEEAARLDGCTLWQSFRHVTLPLVRPALATSAILTAMFSWNEFLIASSVTSQRATTLPVLVSSFITDKGTELGQMSAVSVVIVVPIAVFILATQRYLVRGLTLGAVKE